MKKNIQNQEGQVILIAIILVGLLLVFSSIIVGYTTLEVRASRQSYFSTQALQLADAGIDKAIYELNQSATYSGEANTALGNGEVTISVANAGINYKLITATAYVPNSASPLATKIVNANVAINTSVVSFNTGVQVGIGGLQLDPNSRIVGNVYSNGNINGSGTITSDAVVAAGTAVTADQQDTVQNDNFTFGRYPSMLDGAQSFVPSSTNSLNKVSLYLRKFGNPSDLTVLVVTDNGGVPSKTVLGSGTISAGTITTTFGWIDGTFSTLVNLVGGQKYWIILVANYNSSNYYFWGTDNGGTGSAYSANWNAKTPTWTTMAAALDYQTYMGGQPTSLNGVTVNGTVRAHTMTNCTVGGNAYYATVNTCTVTGSIYPNSQDQPPQAMPISQAQITQWESSASAGGVIAGPYTVNGTVTLGPAQINGDLTVNGTLVLTGPVWVSGNITIGNGATVSVDPSVGNAGAVLLADNPSNLSGSGAIYVQNNSNIIGNGQPNSYVLVLSTNTSNDAIELRNNANGAIFYAANGTLNIWNNVNANQLVGGFVHLNNNAIITYTTGIPSALFFNGPGGSWAYVPGTYSITR